MKAKIYLPIVVVLLTFSFGFSEKSNKIHDNEAIAKAFIDAWTNHDADKLTSLFADNCLYEEVASGRKFNTKEKIASYLNRTIEGLPDYEMEIVNIIASENMVVVESLWSGTNTVGWPYMNIPATNKYVEVRGVTVMEIENNLIHKNRDYWDWDTFMKGIGVE